MVYVDPRDRKFQIIVILPIVVVAIFSILVISDASDLEPLIPVILIGGTAIICFAIYLLVQIVQEKLAEREEQEA